MLDWRNTTLRLKGGLTPLRSEDPLWICRRKRKRGSAFSRRRLAGAGSCDGIAPSSASSDTMLEFGGSTPGSALPSADGPALGAAVDPAVGPAVAATSADGPTETSTTGISRVRPSGTAENGVGPGSGTSSGRTARILGRSTSSIDTSRAVLTSFCMAFRPLLKAQVPNSYIRSSPIGVREMAARTASPISCPRQMWRASRTGSVRIFFPKSARSRIRLPVSSAVLNFPSSSLILCSRLARDFLRGATSRRWISSPSFARAKRSQAMRSPTRAVDHPLVFSGGGAAAQILDSRAAGGSSPCFISTSITGVVDPDPSRQERFADATSSTSVSFSFPRLAARAAS
nr:hypothetical protein Iba_chr06aCG15720 [Ipomoea batatas]